MTHPLMLGLEAVARVQALVTQDGRDPARRRTAGSTLKSIRSRAIGLRRLARAIGWSASRYQYYEEGYQRPHMPPDLIEAIRPHLVDKGTPPVTDAELNSLLAPHPQGEPLKAAQRIVAGLAVPGDAELVARVLLGVSRELS